MQVRSYKKLENFLYQDLYKTLHHLVFLVFSSSAFLCDVVELAKTNYVIFKKTTKTTYCCLHTPCGVDVCCSNMVLVWASGCTDFS